MRLSALAAEISGAIAGHFGGRVYWVIADISGLRYYAAKNYYFFQLVEKSPDTHFITTSISATAWSTAVSKIREFERQTGQKFDNDIEVMVAVRVEFHIQYGLKLNLIDIDPRFTLGKMAMQRQATLQQLLDENRGYVWQEDGRFVTHNQRLAVPVVFRKIALIASPGTDGYRDFKHELETNAYRYQFMIDDYPARVQGMDAEREVLAKLAAILKVGIAYDAVVIVRGGGADTDLLVFDGYLPARAIARFPIPVITGIGHTRNESVCDLMAFQALKTPTRAAAYITEHNRNFEEELLRTNDRITRIARNRLLQEAQQWQYLRNKVVQVAQSFLHHEAMNLNQTSVRMQSLVYNYLQHQNYARAQMKSAIEKSVVQTIRNQNMQLKHREQLVHWVGPEKTLRRGFALVMKNGQPVTGVQALQEGDVITTRFHNGSAASIITQKNEEHE